MKKAVSYHLLHLFFSFFFQLDLWVVLDSRLEKFQNDSVTIGNMHVNLNTPEFVIWDALYWMTLELIIPIWTTIELLTYLDDYFELHVRIFSYD